MCIWDLGRDSAYYEWLWQIMFSYWSDFFLSGIFTFFGLFLYSLQTGTTNQLQVRFWPGWYPISHQSPLPVTDIVEVHVVQQLLPCSQRCSGCCQLMQALFSAFIIPCAAASIGTLWTRVRGGGVLLAVPVPVPHTNATETHLELQNLGMLAATKSQPPPHGMWLKEQSLFSNMFITKFSKTSGPGCIVSCFNWRKGTGVGQK